MSWNTDTVVDRAVIAWANDILEKAEQERNATGVYFGYELSCWSSWTCEYDVTATIKREDGTEHAAGDRWSFPETIRALGAYVEAEERMHQAHDTYHD